MGVFEVEVQFLSFEVFVHEDCEGGDFGVGLGAYGDVVVCHVVDVARDFFASEDDQ